MANLVINTIGNTKQKQKTMRKERVNKLWIEWEFCKCVQVF